MLVLFPCQSRDDGEKEGGNIHRPEDQAHYIDYHDSSDRHSS